MRAGRSHTPMIKSGHFWTTYLHRPDGTRRSKFLTHALLINGLQNNFYLFNESNTMGGKLSLFIVEDFRGLAKFDCAVGVPAEAAKNVSNQDQDSYIISGN